MTTMRVVGECFFWYRLTRVFPDKFYRAVKRLCVCVLLFYNSLDFVWDYPGEPVRYQKGKTKTNLDYLEQETVRGSGISWTICKSARHHIQITMPAPHRSVFFQSGCPSYSPANSVKALKAKHISSHLLYTSFFLFISTLFSVRHMFPPFRYGPLHCMHMV